MNYHNITKDDMNNGDGLRVVLWVAGCEHHCPECHNPETWDYDSGIPFDKNALQELREELSKYYISGITFSGGDPLAPKNHLNVANIICWMKDNFPNKTIWIYSGYTYEQLLSENYTYMDYILSNIDVLVDGRYVKELRDVSLKWRGSKNQRVINMKKTLETGKVVLHCE